MPRAHREKAKEKVAKIRKAWAECSQNGQFCWEHRLSEARARRKVRRVISSGMKGAGDSTPNQHALFFEAFL